jgi:hypothetical protein
MPCSLMERAHSRIRPRGLGGQIGGQVVDFWKGRGRFEPPKTAVPRTPNTMFGNVKDRL